MSGDAHLAHHKEEEKEREGEGSPHAGAYAGHATGQVDRLQVAMASSRTWYVDFFGNLERLLVG